MPTKREFMAHPTRKNTNRIGYFKLRLSRATYARCELCSSKFISLLTIEKEMHLTRARTMGKIRMNNDFRCCENMQTSTAVHGLLYFISNYGVFTAVKVFYLVAYQMRKWTFVDEMKVKSR